MIDGVVLAVGPEAVVVTAARPLAVLSSAPVGGGFRPARALVNLHVGRDFAVEEAEPALEAFARRRGLPAPRVGLLTAAWTEKARVAVETAGGVTAMVAATVGLSHPVTAGTTPAAAAAASTINAIVVVDADPDPAALVNLVMTVTEVKAAALAAAGVAGDGGAATGTATDAVIVAATGRGRRCRFGGPVSDLGWVVARAAQAALGEGARRWRQEHP